MVAIASRLAPRDHRRAWSAEWTAEIDATWRRRPADLRARLRLLRRAMLSFVDAVRFRWEDRQEQRRIQRSVQSLPGKRNMLSDLFDDIRYGVRSLVRTPGFALVAVFTIALGIGSTTTIFSIVDSIVWRPMSYPDPDNVVAVWPGRSFSPREVVRLENELSTFSSIAAYVEDGQAYIREDGADYLFGPSVSAQFFDVLGRQAALGRSFRKGEDKIGANDLAMLSHDFWQREFGGDSSIIGRRILLDKQAHTVIGVMPRGLDVLQRDASFVKPLTMSPESPNYTGNWVNVVGRLAPGVTIEQAREDLRIVFDSWKERFGYSETFGNAATATITPIHKAITENIRSSMMLLMGAVVLTLLVATSNLANLLLNRAVTREQELAVRGALGARPARILRQLLTESTIIAAAGGALGVGLSIWSVRAIVAILPESTPRLEYVTLDGRVLLFSFALVLITGWLAGLFPGLQMLRPAFTSLHSGTRGSSESKTRRAFRSGLVVTELALSVVLLVGSGVLLRSFRAMNEVETGMQPESVLTFGLSPTGDINAGGAAGLNQYYDRVLNAVAALPGVQSADAIHVLPVSGGGWNSGINVDGRETPPGAPYVGVWWRPVTDGYLETVGMHLVAGRTLDASDTESSPWVTVINQAMVRQFWPNENPIGQRFQYNMEGGQIWITVVGIVQDVTHLGLTTTTPPTVYRPFSQSAARLSQINVTSRWIVARTTVDPRSVMESVRQAVAATVPETPIINLRPMSAVIQRSLADPRALTILLTLFAGAAVVLGAVGLYGVVTYTVRQRTRELGIRIALGAKGSDVLHSVMRQGLAYAAIGLPLGLLGAWAGSRTISQALFNVSPTDVVTYVSVSIVLFVVVVLATIAPAVSAKRTDPMISLRAE